MGRWLFPTQWGSTAACGGDGAGPEGLVRITLLPIMGRCPTPHRPPHSWGSAPPHSWDSAPPHSWDSAPPHSWGGVRRSRTEGLVRISLPPFMESCSSPFMGRCPAKPDGGARTHHYDCGGLRALTSAAQFVFCWGAGASSIRIGCHSAPGSVAYGQIASTSKPSSSCISDARS